MYYDDWYAYDVGSRRRSTNYGQAFGSTTRGDVGTGYFGTGTAIAGKQEPLEGAQWGSAFRAEGSRFET